MDSLPPWRTGDEVFSHPVHPKSGCVGVRETLETIFDLDQGRLQDIGVVPLGRVGQKLLALRYFIENGGVWLRYFAWQNNLASGSKDSDSQRDHIQDKVLSLWDTIAFLRTSAVEVDPTWVESLFQSSGPLAGDPLEPDALEALVTLSIHPSARAEVRGLLREQAAQLFHRQPVLLDRIYLASTELDRYPASTVAAGQLHYIIIADKGEMGVRAVREAAALGKMPVVLHSLADDRNALQVRLAKRHGGFAIGLEGAFRECYAGFEQMTAQIEATFRDRFGETWQEEIARAAIYPGYGPLAENAAAIRHFRRRGIVFVGPMQDVVESAGDKRDFRALAESVAPEAVTPGMVLAEESQEEVLAQIQTAYFCDRIAFPGRIKAANGGGGRGQAIVTSLEDLDSGLSAVWDAIETNGWEPGVMFEQNIPETVHLEVQVLRDRFGNIRHFGMRDCTEQRASQKIQEEAPPAILCKRPELRSWIEEAAVDIADRVGYVGAGTIELMYKEGKVYFLEMNTRIQVEHPVTEASHRVRRRGDRFEPLNLVAWQMRLADGQAIDFKQEDIVQTHVAREYRINAEAWNPSLKDPRDGKQGLFFPNAGVFDKLSIPTGSGLSRALKGVPGAEGATVRFDVGFARGDVLVNKDPTFGKLIVAVRADQEEPYVALRRASLIVLDKMCIEGREVSPDGRIIEDREFRTNLSAHRWVLSHDIMVRHALGEEVKGRHVNWVVQALRETADASPATENKVR